MKRTTAALLLAALLLGLTGCGAGSPAAAPVDLSAVYESFQDTLPTMLILDETMMLNLLGIQAEDCAQAVVAICGSGLGADEVWLIEAKDAAALERLQQLASTRLQAKAEETVSYLPDQYAVVEKGQILCMGNYLAFLVSPDVETLKTLFEDAVK